MQKSIYNNMTHFCQEQISGNPFEESRYIFCRRQQAHIYSTAGVMERYWNDADLMSKIASKMGAMNLSPSTAKPAKKIPQASETIAIQQQGCLVTLLH